MAPSRTIAHYGARESAALPDFNTGYVANGSKPEVVALRREVCFAPVSGHRQPVSACPFRANNGLMHRSKRYRHSITSSARSSSDVDTSTPSALAVLRFTTSSNLVGCSIGRSPAFVGCELVQKLARS